MYYHFVEQSAAYFQQSVLAQHMKLTNGILALSAHGTIQDLLARASANGIKTLLGAHGKSMLRSAAERVPTIQASLGLPTVEKLSSSNLQTATMYTFEKAYQAVSEAWFQNEAVAHALVKYGLTKSPAVELDSRRSAVSLPFLMFRIFVPVQQ